MASKVDGPLSSSAAGTPVAAALAHPAGLPTGGPLPSKPPRVCIATSDLLGPIRNGGVGTACAMLAEALATAGQDVTLLYAGSFESGDAEHWRAYYAARGVTFEVPAKPTVPLGGTPHASASYMTYEWLKSQPPFDVVQFPEINGLGFYSLQAKRLGVAFQHTYFCVVLHSPTMWHRLENREHIQHEEDLALEFMERESVARADALVAPTRYLLSWATRWGFRFPPDVYVQPYVSHTVSRGAQRGRPMAPAERRQISELVFFGRLESRKGLELFCDAIEILAARRALTGVAVSFLGKIGRVRHEDGASYVRRRADRLGLNVRLETEMGQPEALQYLRERSALAVMPSLADNMPYAVLECIDEGIPFVAAETGGIPEMIAGEDHSRALAAADPSALADLIGRVLRDGAHSCRGAWDPEEVRRQWISWHERIAGRAATIPEPPSARPLVSLCIATRNRPAALHEALESVRAQTYSPIEVVLVDDASDHEKALAYLDGLEEEFADRGWQIVRRAVKGYPSAARNTAAAHARGEYLVFMDDDNLARPHEVETFVNASLHSGVPIITCVLDHFNGAPGSDRAPATTLRWLPLGPAVALGLFWNVFGDTNMIVRRDTFQRLGGFDEDRDARFVEDWIFLSRAALAGVDMAVVPEPLFWYRVWDATTGPRQLARITQHRRLLPYLQGQSPDRRMLTLFAAGQHDRATLFQPLQQSDEARSSALSVRFDRATKLFAIGPGGARSLRPHQELEISPTADGILLRSLGSDPMAWLPVRPPPFAHSIVRIDLSTSRPTSVQLFWSTRAVPHPAEEQSTIIGFPPGRHVRWAEIPAADHVGRLRLDPSFTPGDFVLHALEIRCEADGGAARRAWLGRLRSGSPAAPIDKRFDRAASVLDDVGSDPAYFSSVRSIEVSRSNGGVLLRALDNDPQVELPAFKPPGRPMVARLEATSSIETIAQLFWATRYRPYCEEQSAVVILRPGRNVGHFAIPRDALGHLRFDPANAACEIVLHSLEIRAER